MNSDLAISFRGVSKRYGKAVALAELDLEIRPGEFVSLLGPSGSGKTTTLNILSGLLKPDSGNVLIGDRDVTHLPPEKRDIAMVFQNYALYPHMTVAENLAFPLRSPARRVGAAEVQTRVGETARMLGIDALLGRYPKEISGGQQQRVALGRAIIRNPSVFLLDEPLSNLDARLRLRMRRDIKALHQRLRSTIVYVTHDQGEAMSLSDRIAIYQGGVLQQFAPPEEIYRQPVNLFVANFMGEREMNNFSGCVEIEGDQARFSGQGLVIPLGLSREDWNHVRGREVVLGIRPQGVGLDARPDSFPVQAEIQLVEPAGAELIFYAQAGEAEICGKAEPGTRIATGDKVTLQLSREEFFMFDRESEVALARGGRPVVMAAS